MNPLYKLFILSGKQDGFPVRWQPFENAVSGNPGYHEKMDRAQAGLGANPLPAWNLFWRASGWTQPVKTACFRQVLLTCPKNSCIMQIWAESGKSALPICNYSQILYQFLAFTQNLKRSRGCRTIWLKSAVSQLLFYRFFLYLEWLQNCITDSRFEPHPYIVPICLLYPLLWHRNICIHLYRYSESF